jgi:CHAD domain-containing protein
MAAKVKDGVLLYVDEQIDALRQHVPAALTQFDEKGVHQARVATRRLKAALDLLAEPAGAEAFGPLNRAGRKLRRLLGPLRDADVMIKNAEAYVAADRHKPARAWLTGVLRADRDRLRGQDAKKAKPVDKRLKPFDAWWSQRRAIELQLAGIEPAIVARLAAQAEAFARDADALAGAGLDAVAARPTPLDVHDLRIDGKALRYTFELAQAHGVNVPKRVFKSFKAMQEALGEWHDFVVLAETTARCWTDKQLALHDPSLAEGVLGLVKLFLKDATKALGTFKSRWKRSGHGVLEVVARLQPTAPSPAAAVVIEPQTVLRPLPLDAPSDPAEPA